MLERWNDAMDVIEDGLGDDVDVSELAKVAWTSEYHFRRVFSVLVGMGLAEYVRRRRITVATASILAGERVLDVALRHGYGSGDAFSRAFTSVHGLTPQQARRPGAQLVTQPRMRFRLTVEGISTMRHRILGRDAFRLVGRHARLPLVYWGENTAMTTFHAALPEGFDERLQAFADIPELPATLSACSGFEDGRADGSSFDYHHAVASTRLATDLPDDLDVVEVPAATWVVFDGGTDDGDLRHELQKLWADAYADWLPSNSYRVVPGPEILQLSGADDGWTSGRGELWLPVEREDHVARP